MSTMELSDEKKIEIGKELKFPFDLSESQIKHIIKYYEKEGWKCLNNKDKIILRKDNYMIQLISNHAFLIGNENEIEKIQTSIEKIYRKTLDRPFVLLLMSEQRINSAILNILHENYRAAVNDIYYATYSAIRAISFVLGNKELAEKFAHPGLSNPNDAETREKAKWIFKRRADWLDTIYKALCEIRKKQKEKKLEEIEYEIKYISSWVKNYLKIDYESYNCQGEYKKLKETVNEDAFYLENAIANCLYWLRIKADYRVDFESLLKSSREITDALYIGICFINIANYLTYDNLKFYAIIRDKNPFYSKKILKGRIVNFEFDRSKLTKKLLLLPGYSTKVEENNPERCFIVQDIDMDLPKECQITGGSMSIGGPQGTVEQEIYYTTKNGKRHKKRRLVPHRRMQYSSLELFESKFMIDKDGSFEIHSDNIYSLSESLDILGDVCFKTHPESFIIVHINSDVDYVYSREYLRYDDY